jgi:hypothetical protein
VITLQLANAEKIMTNPPLWRPSETAFGYNGYLLLGNGAKIAGSVFGNQTGFSWARLEDFQL